jgi:hypothetical protein
MLRSLAMKFWPVLEVPRLRCVWLLIAPESSAVQRLEAAVQCLGRNRVAVEKLICHESAGSDLCLAPEKIGEILFPPHRIQLRSRKSPSSSSNRSCSKAMLKPPELTYKRIQSAKLPAEHLNKGEHRPGSKSVDFILRYRSEG